MENLVVVVLAPSESPYIAEEIFKLAAHSGCQIKDARINTTVTHITMTVLIGGAWNTVARFEASIKKYENQVLVARTQAHSAQLDSFPYTSYIIAPDKPDVLNKITGFLFEQEITLYNLQVESYKAPITDAPMLSISLAFGFPAKNLVADFREHFIVFCDENNFDVAMEPQKN